jgi:excisionase family DNA binding protein
VFFSIDTLGKILLYCIVHNINSRMRGQMQQQKMACGEGGANGPAVADSACLTITVEEAAKVLGISRGTAYMLAGSGALPTIRLGRRLLVPRHALDRLIGIQP